jgi:hypothetical protein
MYRYEVCNGYCDTVKRPLNDVDRTEGIGGLRRTLEADSSGNSQSIRPYQKPPLSMKCRIELIGDEEERKRLLEAIRAAVGKEAARYLYENKVKDSDAKTPIMSTTPGFPPAHGCI